MNIPATSAAPGDKLPAMAISRLDGAELRHARKLLKQLLEQPEAFRDADVLTQLRDDEHGTAFKAIALYLARCARALRDLKSPALHAPVVCELKHLDERLAAAAEREAMSIGHPPESEQEAAEPPLTLDDAIRAVYETIVWRTPGPSEIAIWKQNFDNGLPFHEFLLLMGRSPEAKQPGATIGLNNGTDGQFVQIAHEHTQNRGAGAAEVNHWLVQLENGSLSRSAVLSQLFMAGVKWSEAMQQAAPHDGLSCRIMGTNRDLTATQWARQAEDLANEASRPAPSPSPAPGSARDKRYRHHFRVATPPRVLVSAITSLYRGGTFIEQFMDNITSQEGFPDYCELVIVDADSPEGERATIERYLADFPNINYIRINHRIGIYDAWNVAAQAARGEYLTNANLDDLRRGDSFMLQAGTLEALPFVDVVYQDLYYTFDPRLSFEEIARFGHQTALPVVTAHNMVQYNSPHNAPMWRKSLHDEIGYFDTHYKSAGDYEFWFRCLEAGKVFYKINDPHVAYYQNPKGLSTRPDSRGLMEALDVHKRYCRKLMPEEVTMPSEAFLRRLHPSGGGEMRRDRYRYAMAQDALRTVARTRKFAGAAA